MGPGRRRRKRIKGKPRGNCKTRESEGQGGHWDPKWGVREYRSTERKRVGASSLRRGFKGGRTGPGADEEARGKKKGAQGRAGRPSTAPKKHYVLVRKSEWRVEERKVAVRSTWGLEFLGGKSGQDAKSQIRRFQELGRGGKEDRFAPKAKSKNRAGLSEGRGGPMKERGGKGYVSKGAA